MSEKIGEKSFLKKCEASLVEKEPEKKAAVVLEKKGEKKYFISERFQCIINKLVKSIAMSFKSNSVQVVCLSVLGFCAGVFLTCLLITARRPDSRHGVGGLETSAEPEYAENLSTLLAEVEKDVKASDAAKLTEKTPVAAATESKPLADDVDVDDLLAIGEDAPNAESAAESTAGTVSSIVTVLYIGSANPKQSKPGPMFAELAGTFTLTFIYYSPRQYNGVIQ